MPAGRAYEGLVPYARDGSIVRDPKNAYEWRANDTFRRTLILRALPTSRSSYVVWQDGGGRRYPMFIPSLIEVLQYATVSRGVTVGWWTVTKCSNLYGICRLGGDVVALG